MIAIEITRDGCFTTSFVLIVFKYYEINERGGRFMLALSCVQLIVVTISCIMESIAVKKLGYTSETSCEFKFHECNQNIKKSNSNLFTSCSTNNITGCNPSTAADTNRPTQQQHQKCC